FGIGFWWGSGCCWGGCDWHNHCCHVHCDQFNHFNAHTSIHGTHVNPTSPGGTANWTHDPAHRAGVNYRSPQVAHQFGAAPGSTRVTSTPPRGAPSLSGTRGLSSPTRSANYAPTAGHGTSPPMDRSATAPVARSGAGAASGRMSGDPSRGLSHSTAPA